MRLGLNPNKAKPASVVWEKVVLHVITHLPSRVGYHKERLEIVQTCITSMLNGVRMPHSLIISENESCNELTEWIRDCVKPTMLISSKNFGKTANRKMVAEMLPKDTVLCYTDDDMLFYDNWLAPQLELLKSFPNVASVTGYPVRTSFRWGNTHTKKWAEKHAKLTKGRFIPDEWERDFAISIGRDVAYHFENTQTDSDWLIDYKGMRAYATSHHCQQIGYAGVIAKNLEFDGMAVGEERTFDERLDRHGLRLATTKRLVRHMGNVIDNELRETVNGLVNKTNGGING